VKLVTHINVVPSSKNAWSYNSTPHYTFMAWWSFKAQGQLYFTCQLAFFGSEILDVAIGWIYI